MGATIIRKQVYLGRDQNRKLKALAARRGCTEAEVIRDALDRLAGPEDDLLAQLEADGLLVPVTVDPTLPTPEAAAAFLNDYEQWLEGYARDVGLSEAVLEDRGPR